MLEFEMKRMHLLRLRHKRSAEVQLRPLSPHVPAASTTEESSQPTDSMSKFSFYPSSSNSSRSTSPDLPFPTPLPRSDFLATTFDPSEYLSSLGHRHETLEDLRNELRSRSQLLNQELLDLVNSHYEEFLGLGGSVKGGEGKVEEVKLGLMGFRREVEGVRENVRKREVEVEVLLGERRRVRKEIDVGRRLVEWDEKVERLEAKLMLGDGREEKAGSALEEDVSGDDSSDYGDDESVDVQDDAALMLARLRRRTREFQSIQRLAKKLGEDHPLIVAKQSRIMRIRNTLLLDLATASKQVINADGSAGDRILQIMGMYRGMHASNEAVSAMKGLSLK
ncbi:MAG: hypothetical protein M1828_002078 [Chrysothrix sp. TS-e1954]|nr:MAG: hypothetical protein M1828_002078 [Chrysothrix sp. TS-e1954]